MLPHKLSESSISKVIPKVKPYKLFDGGGLYLLVTPKGGRFWRVKYRYAGKEGTLSLGAYPEVTLGEARIKHVAARRLLMQGISPSVARQLDNLSIRDEAARQKSDAKAAAKRGRLKVSVFADGCLEIWKGAQVLRLTQEEGELVCTLLTKLLREEVSNGR